MPKMKTHKGAAKRFRKTKNGLIKRTKAFRRHHAWAKTSKQILSLKGRHLVSEADQKRVSRVLHN